MRRDQTAHERLIPLLVEIVGARSYLEFGTAQNQTIGKVVCERRFGVDISAAPLDGAQMFSMTTEAFIESVAALHAPFDFLFHDASHSVAQVQRDLRGMWGFMADEALICVHDTNPETVPDTAEGYCGDAWKLAVGLSMGLVEAVTLPFHPGLTIVRKRTRWGPIP